MLFMIVGEDVTNSLEKRMQARPAHIERLKAMQEQGRIVLAGPNPAIESEDPGEAGFSGSLIVAEFASLAEAQAWADADPYMDAGVYRQVTVKPFKKVLPA
ncbi:MAG: YciI family protein [Gammaproteobacteria bacterium]|nr:YciI family protein [Gammaproteobacteria bacterium]